jgi:hypothetical protein
MVFWAVVPRSLKAEDGGNMLLQSDLKQTKDYHLSSKFVYACSNHNQDFLERNHILLQDFKSWFLLLFELFDRVPFCHSACILYLAEDMNFN